MTQWINDHVEHCTGMFSGTWEETLSLNECLNVNVNKALFVYFHQTGPSIYTSISIM